MLERHIEHCESCAQTLHLELQDKALLATRALQPMAYPDIESSFAALEQRLQSKQRGPEFVFSLPWLAAVGVAAMSFVWMSQDGLTPQKHHAPPRTKAPLQRDVLTPKKQPGALAAPREDPAVYVGKLNRQNKIARIASGAQVSNKARIVLGFSLIHPGGYAYIYWASKGKAPQLLYPRNKARPPAHPAKKLVLLGKGKKAGIFHLSQEPAGTVRILLLQTRSAMKQTGYKKVRAKALGAGSFRLHIGKPKPKR